MQVKRLEDALGQPVLSRSKGGGVELTPHGHYLLTRLLLADGSARTPTRVVSVSSAGHRLARRLPWDDLQGARGWRQTPAYAQSKLAQILFTTELARRFGPRGVVAHACHPGFVRTHFGGDGDVAGLSATAVRASMVFAITPAKGARTSIYLATAPEPARSNGGYWARSRPARPSRAARDATAAHRLWELSEALVREAGSAVPT